MRAIEQLMESQGVYYISEQSVVKPIEENNPKFVDFMREFLSELSREKDDSLVKREKIINGYTLYTFRSGLSFLPAFEVSREYPRGYYDINMKSLPIDKKSYVVYILSGISHKHGFGLSSSSKFSKEDERIFRETYAMARKLWPRYPKIQELPGVSSKSFKQNKDTSGFHPHHGHEEDIRLVQSFINEIQGEFRGNEVRFQYKPYGYAMDVKMMYNNQNLMFFLVSPSPRKGEPGTVNIGKVEANVNDNGIQSYIKRIFNIAQMLGFSIKINPTVGRQVASILNDIMRRPTRNQAYGRGGYGSSKNF